MPNQSLFERLSRARLKLGSDGTELEVAVSTGNRADSADSEGSSAASTIPVHELFKIYRGYVEHEDALIDKRLGWLHTIQGFLFVGYVYVVQKFADYEIYSKDVKPANAYTLLKILLCVLPIVGMAVSVLTSEGVTAARDAIEGLKGRWNKASASGKTGVESTVDKLPTLTGGADDGKFEEYMGKNPGFTGRLKWIFRRAGASIHERGLEAPIYLPPLFLIAWLILLIPWVPSILRFFLHLVLVCCQWIEGAASWVLNHLQ